MIAFMTLFLGLVAGVLPVTVSVGPPVASVAIELDGAVVGRLGAAPWTVDLDFGPELSPHEVVARAFDANGKEIARARQWVNLPRSPAEVQILLERDSDGRATSARLTWGSLLGKEPSSVEVTFDGKPLTVSADRRVALPAHAPDALHLLSAVTEFSGAIRSRCDVVVGGLDFARSEASSELTAIPVLWKGDGQIPDAAGLAGWFARKGENLRPVAVERGPAQVWIVRDLGSQEAVWKWGRGGRRILDAPRRGGVPVSDEDASRLEMRLDNEDRLRFLWPTARQVRSASATTELFDSSREFLGKQAGIHWLLTRVEHPSRGRRDRRFADAVAVAGLNALASRGRRAVLLVLGRKASHGSRHHPAAVREYLRKIHVPLFVWSLEGHNGPAETREWGEPEDVSTPAKLREAADRFRRELDSQLVVWLEGQHLPQEIALTERAAGVELVR